jgi:hypothetical protein
LDDTATAEATKAAAATVEWEKAQLRMEQARIVYVREQVRQQPTNQPT